MTWNVASPADITALSFQPAEPATEIQGNLRFSIPHEPTPNPLSKLLIITVLRLCFITWYLMRQKKIHKSEPGARRVAQVVGEPMVRSPVQFPHGPGSCALYS